MTCNYKKVLIEHMVTLYKAVPRGHLPVGSKSARWLYVNSYTSVWLDGYEDTEWGLSIQLAGREWRKISTVECRDIAIARKLVTDPAQIALFDLELELLDQG